MGGPISSGYAGKTASLCFVAFIAILYGFTLASAYKRRHDPVKKMPVNGVVGVGLICAYMIGMMIWEIWKHRQ
jgi:hypothetical protein